MTNEEAKVALEKERLDLNNEIQAHNAKGVGLTTRLVEIQGALKLLEQLDGKKE